MILLLGFGLQLEKMNTEVCSALKVLGGGWGGLQEVKK